MPITSHGVRGQLGDAIANAKPNPRSLTLLALAIPSTLPGGSSEVYDFIGATPALTKWIGARKPGVPIEYNYAVPNAKYEASAAFPLDWVNNDKTALVERRISAFPMRMDQWKEGLVADLINIADSTVCFDGQYFFDTDHTYGKTGTFSNDITATVVSTSAVTALEMANAIMKGYAKMLTFKDDAGEPCKEAISSIAVTVPASLAAVAMQAISAEQLSDGSGPVDNPVLSLKALGIEVTLMASPRITVSSSLGVVVTDTSPGSAAFVLQINADEAKITSKAEGSDYEHDHDAWEFGLKAVGAAGFGLPTDSVLVTLTT